MTSKEMKPSLDSRTTIASHRTDVFFSHVRVPLTVHQVTGVAEPHGDKVGERHRDEISEPPQRNKSERVSDDDRGRR